MANKWDSPAKAFWTIQGIAEHLDVSERTVHRWVDSGELVAHRFGRSVRISDSDRRAFLSQRRGRLGNVISCLLKSLHDNDL